MELWVPLCVHDLPVCLVVRAKPKNPGRVASAEPQAGGWAATGQLRSFLRCCSFLRLRSGSCERGLLQSFAPSFPPDSTSVRLPHLWSLSPLLLYGSAKMTPSAYGD